MDHFHYKDGHLFAEDVSLTDLAYQVGTPFYCYSSATLERHFTVLDESLEALNHTICYAVKANSNLSVLKTLAKLGAGADVVSEGEVRLALAAGIPPEKIVFSGVGKTGSEMAFALDQGIFQFNVESEPELRLLSEVASAKKKKAPVALRVNPDVTPGTHAKISTGQKESKFGIPIAQAADVYKLAAGLSGIQVQGVSVHIGSQLTSLEPFKLAFQRLREFVEGLREDGHEISVIDLGGGLGIPYEEAQEPPLPHAYGEMVCDVMKGMDAHFVFEPGRMIAGNAGILVTRVIYVKQTGEKIFVIVDGAMNDLLRPTLYHAYHNIVHVAQPSGDTPTEMVDVVGPVCETGDFLAEKRLLKLPKPGDLLAVRTAGAYGAVMAGTYNARPLVAEIMVRGDEYAIVAPRQTYAELIERQQIPDWLDEE